MNEFFEEISKPSAASTPQNLVESFYYNIGLMSGAYAPLGRVAFGFGLAAAVLWFFKPGFSFEGGHPRPWKLTHNSPNSTLFAWWIIAGVVGLSQGLFV